MPTIRLTWKQTGMFIVLIIGLVGAFCLFIGLYGNIMDVQSSSWPVTEGIITSSQVESWGIGLYDPVDYRPAVTYQYQVGGKTYNGSQISSGATFYGGVNDNGYDQAIATVIKYPVGSIVQVHYNPDNPSNAVLETQSNLIEQIPLIIGVVMISIALIGAFMLFRSERRS